MNLFELIIKRLIATSLIMLGIAMFGLVAYRALPVSDLPNVDFPTLNAGGGLPAPIRGRWRRAERDNRPVRAAAIAEATTAIGMIRRFALFYAAHDADTVATGVLPTDFW